MAALKKLAPAFLGVALAVSPIALDATAQTPTRISNPRLEPASYTLKDVGDLSDTQPVLYYGEGITKANSVAGMLRSYSNCNAVAVSGPSAPAGKIRVIMHRHSVGTYTEDEAKDGTLASDIADKCQTQYPQHTASLD